MSCLLNNQTFRRESYHQVRNPLRWLIITVSIIPSPMTSIITHLYSIDASGAPLALSDSLTGLQVLLIAAI